MSFTFLKGEHYNLLDQIVSKAINFYSYTIIKRDSFLLNMYKIISCEWNISIPKYLKTSSCCITVIKVQKCTQSNAHLVLWKPGTPSESQMHSHRLAEVIKKLQHQKQTPLGAPICAYGIKKNRNAAPVAAAWSSAFLMPGQTRLLPAVHGARSQCTELCT